MLKVWFLLFYFVAGHTYTDYTLCLSRACVDRVIQAAEADPAIYRYEMLRPGYELPEIPVVPPFQVFPAAKNVWKNL